MRILVVLPLNICSVLMDLPKIRSVVSCPENPDGDRLVLLRMLEKGGLYKFGTKPELLLMICKLADIPPEAQEYLDKEVHGLVKHEIKLDYDYWTAGLWTSSAS